MNAGELKVDHAITLVMIEGLIAMMGKEVQANTRIAQEQQTYRQCFVVSADETGTPVNLIVSNPDCACKLKVTVTIPLLKTRL